jgi:LemA protein
MEWLVPVAIVVAVVVIAGIYLWATYRSLVSLSTRVDDAWGGIESKMRKRADLVPELVSSVEAYASHERALLDDASRARTESLDASSPIAAGRAESRMQQVLTGLFAVAEGYPALQASQNYLQLQGALVETEDEIQASRRFYNGGVRELNVKIKQFPNNLFAKGLGLTEREFFEDEDAASVRQPPRVQF